jgi:hypothetical protein
MPYIENIYKTHKNWTVKVVETDSDSDRIKVLDAPELSSSVFREALSHLGNGIINVQINVPVSDALKQFAAGINSPHALNLPLEPLHRDATGYATDNLDEREYKLKVFFNKYARYADECANKSDLVSEWARLALAMPRAVDCVFDHYSETSIIIAGANESFEKGRLRPHDHISSKAKGFKPGYTFNFASAADGTVFVDEQTKTFWFTKGWSYNLFAKSGHKNAESAIHSEPFTLRTNAPQQRKTFITNIDPMTCR